MQIGLGTVQFGLDYGVSNNKGHVSDEEVVSILNLCKTSGIHILDTASIYGDSEQRLGETVDHNHFKLVTKIYPNLEYFDGLYLQQINQSLVKLKTNHLYGLMLHRGDELLGQDGSTKFSELQNLKQRGLVEKVGVSVYDPETLVNIINRFNLDIIQVPLNVFDQRFITSGALEQARDKGIEIHSRSTFLQGLLLMDETTLPSYFAPFKDFIVSYYESREPESLIAPLHFIKQTKLVDYAIVGCTSCNELAQILDAKGKESTLDFNKFINEDEGLILPTNWKL